MIDAGGALGLCDDGQLFFLDRFQIDGDAAGLYLVELYAERQRYFDVFGRKYDHLLARRGGAVALIGLHHDIALRDLVDLSLIAADDDVDLLQRRICDLGLIRDDVCQRHGV